MRFRGQGIGLMVVPGNAASSASWSSYWAHRSEVLFFGEISKITGGRLYNQKSGATDYLTVGGSVGSYTFQCPNTAAYLAADTDQVWHFTDNSIRTVLEADLIGYDFTRTIIKYEDESDYSIQTIMILSSSFSSAKMRKDFHLSLWWDGTLSQYGNLKGNREAARSVWTPLPSGIDAPTNLTLTLISGGIRVEFTDNSGGIAQNEIWAKVDSADYTLITTLDANDESYDHTLAPADLVTYKVRSKIVDTYSDFSTEESITMVGVELVDQSQWYTIAYYYEPVANWSQVSNTLASDGNSGIIQKLAFWTIGLTYRINYTIVVNSGSVGVAYASSYVQNSVSGTYSRNYTVASTVMRHRSFSFNGAITALSIKRVLVP